MDVEISIIVPALGNPGDLYACLKSIVEQRTSARYEVLVAYCEQDKDVERVVRQFPSILAVTAHRYLLAGESRNLGAAKANANVLAFVDSDCIIQPDWVDQALRTMNDGALQCSGPIRDTYPWNLIASTDNRLQFADFPGGRPYGPASYFPCAHLVVQREIFESIGGFSLALVAQDVIFTMAVADRWPAKSVFDPKLVASHAGRHTWMQFLSHHSSFGYARAAHRIQINNLMVWIFRYPWLAPLLFFRRLAYISLRVLQWNLFDLPRYLLQLPFVIAGLIAWTIGFYHGVRERDAGSTKNW